MKTAVDQPQLLLTVKPPTTKYPSANPATGYSAQGSLLVTFVYADEEAIDGYRDYAYALDRGRDFRFIAYRIRVDEAAIYAPGFVLSAKVRRGDATGIIEVDLASESVDTVRWIERDIERDGGDPYKRDDETVGDFVVRMALAIGAECGFYPDCSHPPDAFDWNPKIDFAIRKMSLQDFGRAINARAELLRDWCKEAAQ